MREQEINHKIESELHSTSVEEVSTSPAPSSGVLWGYSLKVVVEGALLSGGSSGEDTPKLSQVFGTISWRLRGWRPPRLPVPDDCPREPRQMEGALQNGRPERPRGLA